MAKPTQPVRGRPKRSSTVPLTGSGELDRSSEVPLYFQLAAALKVMLEVDDWEAGARFASERELEEEFGVSRAVIRPALELLVGDGAIFRIKGSGAFVAPPRREVRVAGLAGLWSDQSDEREVKVLSARKHQPDRTVSHFLAIEDRRTPVAHVHAVVDPGQPSVILVPTAQALEAGTEPSQAGGLDLTRATVSVEHTFFGEWGSSQVGASAGDPALMGRFVQFARPRGSKREYPVEFARLIYRADGAQLAFELS
jgi:DNA-binding GntR family transcriptional regulator